jgi:translation initiation factor 1
VEHPEYGEVIQLQGDQRNKIKGFLASCELAKEEQIKVCTQASTLTVAS